MLWLLLSRSAFALDAAKYYGGSYDGHGAGTSTGQTLGSLDASKYYGGSYDGHGQGTSTDQVLGLLNAVKYHGGSYDGYGQGTSAPGLTLGLLLAAKYYGGSYDGHGSSTSAPDISLPVMLASLTAATGNRLVRLTWITESEVDNAGFHVYRSLEEEGPYERITTELIRGAGNSSVSHEYGFTDRNVDNGITYWYRIASVSTGGGETLYGLISATPDASTKGLPAAFGLSQNFPNPFNPSTEILFQLPEASRVVISVYDALGRVVGVLLDDDMEAGEWSVVWDAKDAACGLYFVKMQTEDFVCVRKMALVK